MTDPLLPSAAYFIMIIFYSAMFVEKFKIKKGAVFSILLTGFILPVFYFLFPSMPDLFTSLVIIFFGILTGVAIPIIFAHFRKESPEVSISSMLESDLEKIRTSKNQEDQLWALKHLEYLYNRNLDVRHQCFDGLCGAIADKNNESRMIILKFLCKNFTETGNPVDE
ncbi:MAG: hypothetical protein M0Q91_09735 [Methanoregula sp.]|jgi:hypothetical protein|nr:hypothetical protein [Methanoregula sp.]